MTKVTNQKRLDSSEAGMFVADSAKVTAQSAIGERLDSLPRGRGGKLPPLNPRLPDSTRDSIRNSGRKKRSKGKENDGYVWKEEDFEPMRCVPSKTNLFIVGGEQEGAFGGGEMNTNPMAGST